MPLNALNEQSQSNLSYKGFKGTTFFLVIFGYVTSSAFLVFGYLDAITWKDTAFGLLAGYVVRDGMTKVMEMYYQKKIAEMPADLPSEAKL